MKHPSYRVEEDDESAIPELDPSGNKIEQFKEYGVIAQQIQDIPELAHMVKQPPPEMPDTLNVNYTDFIPLLIKSNQELHERIKQLENKI